MDNSRNDDREAEAGRILDRLARESGPGSLMARAVDGVRGHVTARDDKAEDAIELWGTRIGRALGLLITVALFAWLILLLLRG